MKNPREYKRMGDQYAYVLDCINPENYNVECEDDKAKVKFVLDTFNKEYNYVENKRRLPNLQHRIAEWLSGLPSAIGVAFSTGDIEDLGTKWGYEKAVKNGDFVAGWFRAIALRLMQLAMIFGIDISKLY